MRRRMYYVMPELASARRIMDDLLRARVEERHSHFLAKPGTLMDGLHEANVLQKTDLVHGARPGRVVGALLGCAGGGLLVSYGLAVERCQIATVIGAIPNSRLRQFDTPTEDGCILLMIDVPEHKVETIKAVRGERHPEAQDRGLDPHIPVFP
jgi:hypothetical protein